MIKLKIGDNFLITTHKDTQMKDFIIYTMGCFEGHNKLLLGLDLAHIFKNDSEDYLKALREEQARELYILVDASKVDKLGRLGMSLSLRDFIVRVKEILPTTKIAIIKVHNKKDSREFKIARDVYETLVLDKKSILKHLDRLDDYKLFVNRQKAIPGELKVINESIKELSKTKKVCERIITKADLDYLNLIDELFLNGSDLVVTIKPLPINPSEPLGKCFNKESFEKNKYLAKVAEYLYKGCHFKMVGTKIVIHSNFTPGFVETLDHRFDDMFVHHNWSSIGYPHFGRGHLCGGEFNDVIAHTAEHGVEYYFMCLKQYLTTANMRDYAGRKVWWYPIYDDNDNLVYCAGLDILKDTLLTKDLTDDVKEELRNMDLDTFLKWKERHGVTFSNINIPSTYCEGYSGKEDMFLEYCKEHNPEVYEELKKGAK